MHEYPVVTMGTMVPGRWLRTRVLVGWRRRPWEMLVVIGDLCVGTGIVPEDVYVPRVLAWARKQFEAGERPELMDDAVMLPLLMTRSRWLRARFGGNMHVEEAYTLMVLGCSEQELVLYVVLGGDKQLKCEEEDRDGYETRAFIDYRRMRTVAIKPIVKQSYGARIIPRVVPTDAVGVYDAAISSSEEEDTYEDFDAALLAMFEIYRHHAFNV